MNGSKEPAAGVDPWNLTGRRLYLCTPDRPDLAHFVTECILGGVDIVQLRDKGLPDEKVVERAALLQRVCTEMQVPFILNDRPDLAAGIGADGVHVGQDDTPPDRARAVMGAEAVIGLSTHARSELDAALGEGGATGPAPVDYISAGPVAATPTKPGRPGTGLGYVTRAVERSPWPVWITGGVDPTTVPAMIEAGASHFVVVRWLTEAADPRASARALRRTIDTLVEGR